MTFCRDLSWSQFYDVFPSVTWIIVKFASDTHLEGAVSTLETRSKSKAILQNLFQNISTVRGSAIFRKHKSNTCSERTILGDYSELQNSMAAQSTQIALRPIIKNIKSKAQEHRLS